MKEKIIEASEILKFNAVFADDHRITDAKRRIKRIQTRAKALSSAYRKGQPSSSLSFSDLCIELHFSTHVLNLTKGSLSLLIEQIDALDTACADALAHIDRAEKNTPSKQTVWGLWVDALSNTLRANGLPVNARKDLFSSAFVAFVRELQKSVPHQYRPSFHSNGALAQAINRARR